MSKAMLIMDMPKCCAECQLCLASKESHTGQLCWKCAVYPTVMIPKRKANNRQEYCPLQELPKKKEEECYTVKKLYRVQGYNACIDEILGGAENG